MSDYELDFWNDCTNTLGEELKQLVYARYMGLTVEPGGPGLVIDLKGKAVLDIGGGPVSLLLKCIGRSRSCMVVDPGKWPKWVMRRYRTAGIGYAWTRAESLTESPLHWTHTDLMTQEETHGEVIFDEVWIYNVLQHVDDPELVIANARKAADLIRIFEWLDVPAYEGHPHELKADELLGYLGSNWAQFDRYTIRDVDEDGAVGRAFFGAFST
jgi:hypothetical protein